jgi:drug/metabolite transporter (DMT)-like permease
MYLKSPYVLGGITILAWSFGAYLVRLVTLSSPYVLTFLSFGFTLLVLGGYFWRQAVRNNSRMWQHFRWEYCFWGIFGYVAYLVPQLWSYQSLGNASEGAILNYTWPIFAAMIANVMYRKIQTRSAAVRWIEYVALALGFVSVAIVATKGAFDVQRLVNLNGLMWGLVASAAYGLFSAYSAKINEEQNPVFLLTAIISSIVVMLPLVLTDLVALTSLTVNDIVVAALLGGILNGVAYITWTTALNQAMVQGISISRIAQRTIFV